ncbi:MAG: hypothetical protein ACRC0S_04455 [Fusobacteriaceae bacterium]
MENKKQNEIWINFKECGLELMQELTDENEIKDIVKKIVDDIEKDYDLVYEQIKIEELR